MPSHIQIHEGWRAERLKFHDFRLFNGSVLFKKFALNHWASGQNYVGQSFE